MAGICWLQSFCMPSFPMSLVEAESWTRGSPNEYIFMLLSALVLIFLYSTQCWFFIIQSPLPGVDYIGYLRSSRPSPGLLHNVVQIFPFPVPPPLVLWAHFYTHGPISLSWPLFGSCLSSKSGSWALISSCMVFWAGSIPTCKLETFPKQLYPLQCWKKTPQSHSLFSIKE